MNKREFENIEPSLKRIKQIGKIVNILMKALCVVLAIFWLLFVALYFLSSSGMVPVVGLPGSPYEAIILCACGMVIIAIIFFISQMFSDVAKEESPFSFVQVKRLRIVAILLLTYMLLEVLLSPGIVSQMKIGEVGLGYTVMNGGNHSKVSINLGAALGAIVFWGMSLIFKYGVLLQEFSDETL